jgi:hypothetical protein
VLRVFVGNRADGLVHLEQRRVRIGHENRRMGGDDELRAAADQWMRASIESCRIGESAASGSSRT